MIPITYFGKKYFYHLKTKQIEKVKLAFQKEIFAKAKNNTSGKHSARSNDLKKSKQPIPFTSAMQESNQQSTLKKKHRPKSKN